MRRHAAISLGVIGTRLPNSSKIAWTTWSAAHGDTCFAEVMRQNPVDVTRDQERSHVARLWSFLCHIFPLPSVIVVTEENTSFEKEK